MQKKKGKGRRRRTVLFIVELIVLFVVLGALFVYAQINSQLDKLDTQELDMERVEMNDLVNSESSTGYMNIAIFGIDSRLEEMDSSYADEAQSDTIMIATIDNDNKVVKLISVYRDTYLDIGEGQYGSNSYQKCNAAYAYGGPEQAISMLNTNFDLNISSYVTVNFDALVTAVDLLGGLDIEMTGAEVVHMNNYCVETSEVTGKSYTPIEYPGSDDYVDTYHLNGVQACSYARIRYVGLDFQRTERQRIVIQKMVEKAKEASLETLNEMMDEIFPMIQTSLTKSDIFSMGASMITYNFGETTGFPFVHFEYETADKGSLVVPATLEYNVKQLHEFIYGDTDYEPSETVKERSAYIEEDTGVGYDEKTGEIIEYFSHPDLDEVDYDDSDSSDFTTTSYDADSDSDYGDTAYDSGGVTDADSDSDVGDAAYDSGGYGLTAYDSGGADTAYDSGGADTDYDSGGYGDTAYDSGGGYGDFSYGNGG